MDYCASLGLIKSVTRASFASVIFIDTEQREHHAKASFELFVAAMSSVVR